MFQAFELRPPQIDFRLTSAERGGYCGEASRPLVPDLVGKAQLNGAMGAGLIDCLLNPIQDWLK